MLEHQKSELILGTNSFQEPAEVSGMYAWIKQIVHLIFLKKGTYPSNPLMGVDLPSYDYTFIDDSLIKLESEITDQIRTYLPDVPFKSVTLFTQDHPTKQEKILIMVINFTDDASKVNTVVVASANSTSRIDFDISV